LSSVTASATSPWRRVELGQGSGSRSVRDATYLARLQVRIILHGHLPSQNSSGPSMT
jgi:hypothetical protein